jgi:Mrp family chromosome partitioning ATPase
MRRLLTEIAERYADRIVIFDSPPLLMTTGQACWQQMGQIVMVVEAEQTTQHAVKALKHIERCPNINVVYNKSTAFPGAEYYGDYD